jgi:hypothetical protein
MDRGFSRLNAVKSRCGGGAGWQAASINKVAATQSGISFLNVMA